MTTDTAFRCSFCGKSGEHVEDIIRGPGQVLICKRCVGYCNAILAERRAGKRLRKRRRRPSGSLRRRKATVVGSDEAVSRVRAEYESIASLSRLPLNALNRSPDPTERYHSMDEYTRELWARANAIASFAVSTGLISSVQAGEILRGFLDAHPDIAS